MKRICRKEEVTQYYSVLLTPTMIGEINECLSVDASESITLSEDDIVRAWEEDYNSDDESDILNLALHIHPHYEPTVGEYVREILFEQVYDHLQDEIGEYGKNYTEED